MRIETLPDESGYGGQQYYVDAAGNFAGLVGDVASDVAYVGTLGAEELLQLSVGLGPDIDLENPDIAAALDVTGDGRFSSADALETLKADPVAVADAVGLGETQKKVANGVTYTLPVNMPTQQSVYEDLAKEYLKTYGADLDLNKQAELMQKAGLIVEDPATMQKVDNSMGNADMGEKSTQRSVGLF